MSALLFSEGQSSSKHSGVMSLFDRLWIKPDRLPAEAGAFYHLMFEKRQKGDYDDLFFLEQAELEGWIAEAKAFIKQVRDWLRENAGIDID